MLDNVSNWTTVGAQVKDNTDTNDQMNSFYVTEITTELLENFVLTF